jgi:transcriptional regulator with XRE-family HTH domain
VNLINRSLVRELRLAQGLTAADLARATSRPPRAIRYLEEGGGNQDVTLQFLVRLADALGVKFTSLLTDDAEPQTAVVAEDAYILQAVFASATRLLCVQEIAQILDWDHPRVREALRALSSAQHGTGQRVHCAHARYGLRPAEDVLTSTQRERAQRLGRITASRDAGLQSLRLLRDVLAGEVKSTPRSHAQRVVLGTLLKAGTVEHHKEDGYRATAQVLRALDF